MASLAASLLAAPDAHAGSYSGPVYTGGTYTNVGPGNKPLPDGFNSSNGLYGSVATPGYYIGSATGQITATFTWQPAYPGEPPPANVIVYQHAVAQFSFQAITKTTASCSDGLGDAEQDTKAGPPSPAIYSGVSSGTYYTEQPPDSSGNVVLQCSPSASFNWSAMGVFPGGASVGYTAAVYPVTITLTGTLMDSSNKPVYDGSGNQQILVGQGCGAVIGASANCTLDPTSYQWSVSGTTFQDWEPTTQGDQSANPPVPANPNASYYDPGPGDQTKSSYHWFWNDLSQTSETVTCTATVIPPAGDGNPFSVTATQKVMVYVPTLTNPNNSVGMGYIQSGTEMIATDGAGGDGSIWTAAVSMPATPNFGTGKWGYAQLITAEEYATQTNGIVITSTDTIEGEGLDAEFPYMESIFFADGRQDTEGDAPAITGLNTGIASVELNSGFKTYLMFQPPGPDSKWVTLAKSYWFPDFNAKQPDPGGWPSFPSTQSVGSVTRAYNFKTLNEFPTWTKIIATGKPFLHN